LKIGTENQNRKISTNRKRFLIFKQNVGIKQRNGKPKQKNLNKPRKIFDFEQNGGNEQRNGKPKKKNYNKPRNIR